MKKWCFFLCIGCACSLSLYGQGMDKKAGRKFQAAKELFRQQDYEGALRVLQEAESTGLSCAEFYFLQADIYDRLKKNEEEGKAIEKGLSLDSLKYTSYYYFLGECYFGQGNYAKARDCYRLYLERDPKRNREKETLAQIADCDFAEQALRTQERQSVELYIASEKDVYWPSLDITGKTVLFTRLDEKGEDIWVRADSSGYPLNLNTEDGNEGTQSLTADGQMMYFTGCERSDSRGSCDIYVAYRISDSIWSDPVNLGYPVNTDAWEAQPAISADGTKLFFASTRAGGKGGSDIWYSTLLQRSPDGRQAWSEPRPLYFNTPGNEMAPFLYYDGKVLFFSSDGYPGMGGMDIYRVNLEQPDFPENIGITVNTCRNEMGFVVDASGKRGYFSSDRSGTKNIYRYTLEEKVQCDEMAYLRLEVQDESGREIIPDKLLVIRPERADTLAYYDEVYAPGEMISCVPANSLLLICVQKADYLYYSDTLQIGRADYAHPQARTVVLKKIRPEVSQVLKGIFFDVDDYALQSESRFELEQLTEFLKQNPYVKVEIAGFTDNSGSKEHNLRLSEARAFEVYKYLFVRHIRKERMTYKGYGEEEPVDTNATPEGKAKNRRTEIRIIEEKK